MSTEATFRMLAHTMHKSSLCSQGSLIEDLRYKTDEKQDIKE